MPQLAQKGPSVAEFQRRYGTQEQFVCPHCGGKKHSYAAARRIFQCSACRVQTSARAGTIFHKSRTPLTKWFLAIYRGRPADARCKWTNTGLGNSKSAITGTCRSCDPRHTARYLAAYEWRFNRRFELDKNVERLARVAARTAPMPYRSIAAVGAPAEMAG